MSDQDPTVEEATVDEQPETPMGEHVKSKSTWLRFVFMCVSALLLWLAGVVGMFVVVAGFLWVLFTGKVNQQLQGVGGSLATYVQQIVRYLTYNTDERPFPLGGDWPSDAPTDDQGTA